MAEEYKEIQRAQPKGGRRVGHYGRMKCGIRYEPASLIYQKERDSDQNAARDTHGYKTRVLHHRQNMKPIYQKHIGALNALESSVM